MLDFVLSGAMSFFFGDALSARRPAYIADDGCIVAAALNRVDPVATLAPS